MFKTSKNISSAEEKCSKNFIYYSIFRNILQINIL